MFDRLGELAQEHAELERTLADSAVHSDPERARALARRYGEISPVVETYHQWQETTMPVGLCVIRTAESVVLTLCPPGPEER